MTWKQFLYQLILVSLGAAAILFGIHFIPAMRPYDDFSIYCILFFVIFCQFIFLLGKIAVSSNNVNLFNFLIMALMFFKIIFSIAFIFIYKQNKEPETAFYIIPFLIVYIIYTIFEVYFMSKVGYKKPSNERAKI
jgi:hypothetical protein